MKLTPPPPPRPLDRLNAVVRTIDHRLDNGRIVRLCEDEVREYGLTEALRRAGFGPGRVPVMQDGEMVGTLPDGFDVDRIGSQSTLYTPRPGDLRRVGNRWIASPMLGPGDFDAMVGFKRA